MVLSWNEIKDRAIKFSKEWENETREDAEAKSFLDSFCNVFGIDRRRFAKYEHHVKKIDGKEGIIDFIWNGMLLVEMKSRGRDLDKAHKQARDYFPGLKDEELPKYILVSDFARFRLYDLINDEVHDFKLKDFYKNIKLFSEIAGRIKIVIKDEDPVNIKAAVLMGKLHDSLKEVGYEGHDLEVYLVRLLFCLFGDDTTLFEKGAFEEYIRQRTKEDGSDLGQTLAHFFQILNTSDEKRQKNLDEQLAAFPYVNGKLFEENLHVASFSADMRENLLECSAVDWSKISPAIFGSMFQSVMNKQERRNLGAHYTSEKNILKLIKPLFLDELYSEFEKVKKDKKKLTEFHKKLSSLKFLDPACGCGNFLVITYRELRLLELEVLKVLQKGQQVTDIEHLVNVDVDQFYGIEIEEWPAQIAQVALWLMDHQMNLIAQDTFGRHFNRLPLKKSPTIVHGNALRIDWQSLLNPVNSIDVYAKHANVYLVQETKPEYKTLNVQAETVEVHKGMKPEIKSIIRFDYILGNPPFIGKQMQNAEQKEDIDTVFIKVKGAGVLDYVTCWYIKAAQYIQNAETKVAFVSTNSISQGEQVGLLWGEFFNKYKIKIHFAHRTFKWNNEAKGNAAVHVVIIGFANYDIPNKTIYEYENISGEPHGVKVKNINPYLVEANDSFLENRKKTICEVPQISYGSMANDGGNLLLSDEEKKAFVKSNPDSVKFIKPFLGSYEYLNGIKRWCLWLKDVSPTELKQTKEVFKRIEAVKDYRIKSTREATRKLAAYPFLFGEDRQPESNYLLIPGVSSENRKYIPVGFLNKNTIASDLSRTIANATLYHFGILSSEMHMAWVRSVCGRLKSDYRYSNSIVYNNFPWPENPNEKQKQAIEKAAQKVLDVRKDFPESSLADLYDPLTMPPALAKAHQELDKAVDLCYRPQPFINETKRIEFLFELYDKYTAGLFVKEKKKRKKNEEMGRV